MGNQLVGIAPSQIYPVEHYIQDLTDQHRLSLKYQASLGSTRFFKVARCDSDRGPVVVKVFVIHDPSNDIKRLERRLKELEDEAKATGTQMPRGDKKVKAVRARASDLAQAFVQALQHDNIIEVFSSAGHRLSDRCGE